jgi:hypothetical protein
MKRRVPGSENAKGRKSSSEEPLIPALGSTEDGVGKAGLEGDRRRGRRERTGEVAGKMETFYKATVNESPRTWRKQTQG